MFKQSLLGPSRRDLPVLRQRGQALLHDVQYKTTFVLAHKIRESLIAQRDETELDGEMELDGAYVHEEQKKLTGWTVWPTFTSRPELAARRSTSSRP